MKRKPEYAVTDRISRPIRTFRTIVREDGHLSLRSRCAQADGLIVPLFS